MKQHADFTRLAREWGIHTVAQDYMPAEYKGDFQLAADAQPALVTAMSSAGIPAYLTSFMDPQVVRVFQAPNKGADILGEKKEGDWTKQTAIFPVVENTGEVSSYGDYNENGRSDINVTFPQRQSYHFQTHLEYGDRETDLMATTSLNLVAEKQIAAAKTLDKFMDYTYHYGVQGLQNYGTLNDPALSAAVTPGTKQAGGTGWVKNGTVNATANEVVLDIQALFYVLVAQTGGLVDSESKMTLVLPPQANVGILAINSFGQDVVSLLKKGFPNLKIKTSPRYATAAGNVAQLIADEVEGVATGYCAFTEKMRDGRVVAGTSSYKQKKTAGSWGAVIRYPAAIATMLGV